MTVIGVAPPARFASPRPRLTLLASLAVGVVLSVLGGCASAPAEPDRELLDPHSGVTLLRLEKPLEFVANLPRAKGADPFAYAAPFATDQMGTQRYFVWLAVPADEGLLEAPQLLCDGVPLAAQPLGSDAARTGLSAGPYAAPAPWSASFYYQLEPAALRALAAAHGIAIVVRYAATGEARFGHDGSNPLGAFLDRLGPI